MELIADRFVVVDTDRAIDLSTGDQVVLIVSHAGRSGDPMRWAVRCDVLSRLRHPAVARLVDHGPLNDGHRFEAWRCSAASRRVEPQASEAVAAARAFFRANRLTTGELSLNAVRDWHARCVVIPDGSAGYEDPTPAEDRERGIDVRSCGIGLVERPAVAAISEMLGEAASRSSPAAISLFAEPGAGALVAIEQLARTARANGLVPISAGALAPEFLPLVHGRTLCIFDRRGGAAGWRDLVERVLASPRPHVLVHVGSDELPLARSLQLERVAHETLMAAVRPAVRPEILERAATRARGLPGLFARILWGITGHASRTSVAVRPSAAVAAPSIAAEEPAVYGEGAVQPLHGRLARALELIERGRHAPGDREIRSAVGGLARRHDWNAAARGSVALAAALLKRGRTADAQSALEEARGYATKAEGNAWLLRVATATGIVWLELGRLDEAEAALHSAYAMARTSDADIVPTAVALSRCLFWRGKYDEADRTLEPFDVQGRPLPVLASVKALRSRASAGLGNLRGAIAHATSAIDYASGLAHPDLLAEAAAASAFAHLRAGDVRGVEHDVAVSLQAAHKGRDPLGAMKARLILAEQRRRAGRPAEAKALVARGRRLSLPATLRGRLALVADLVAGTRTADAVSRHAWATGLKALALFAPEGDADDRANVAVHAAVDILQLCHAAEEEQSLLPRVCARLRERLDSSGVAVFAREADSAVHVASDGNRIDVACASRVIAGGHTVPPYQHDARLESGAPIRYGGDVIGAIVARWTIGARPHPPQAHMILTMAAAAVGPAVAASLARRRQAAAASLGELMGISAAMHEVRAAVDRAANAPFAVLIEGESGSGKELVARGLHCRSPRRDRPFCTLNCAALPEDLVEAELFGHGRGAFTGAVAERAGVFEAAHTGTLFLDEIAELSPRAQAKVLRTIQEGEVRRVGENTSRRIDVRLLSATNRDLRTEAAANRFRLDLLYRLDVLRIVVPPLRDRAEDIAVLAEHFWREATARLGSRATLSAATLAALSRYPWPGNVRELQNVLAALAVRAPRRGAVPPAALPPAFGTQSCAVASRLTDARRTFDQQFVRAALVRTGGHRGRAAEELGLSRQGLAKLMGRLQISGSEDLRK